jgi:HlyD family secretion protein
MLMLPPIPVRPLLRHKPSSVINGFNIAWMLRWGILTVFTIALSGAMSGCNVLPKGGADAQTRPAGSGPTAVDVAIAATAPLESAREYTGTTQPFQEVAIRAQAEGQLRQLNVDVGDQVEQGQTLAQIDDSLLNAATLEAEAELASRRTEISQLQTQVSDANTQVEQSRLQLQQAESDAARYSRLAREGAVSQQQAEQSRTQAKTAAQVLLSSKDKVRNQEQGIEAANDRIDAQKAVIAQRQERRSYAVVTAPIAGSVLTRSTEQGSLVQVGNELLRLGDFSQAKVTVQVSELDLANVRVGGAAKVKLDAFPKQQSVGRVTRISPAANPTSRLVPVEVTIPNPTGKVGSGLLARVSFTQSNPDRIVVPLSALQDDRAKDQGSNSAKGNPDSKKPADRKKGNAKPKKTSGTLFVVTGEGDQAKVAARSVALGEQMDGKVQIISGLNPGDRFVSRSGKPLKDGDPVRLSILSAP